MVNLIIHWVSLNQDHNILINLGHSLFLIIKEHLLKIWLNLWLQILFNFISNFKELNKWFLQKWQRYTTSWDLPTPQTSSDALMILADSKTVPSIVQIPRQIQKQEFLKLMPLEWLSNYEKLHKNSQPVQTSNTLFEKRVDGTVQMTFQPPTEHIPPRNSFSYSCMITAVLTAQENIPIYGFASDGYPIYPNKINDSFLWDVPVSHMCDLGCPCLEEEDDDDFNRRPRHRKKKSHRMEPCQQRPPLSPDDPDNTTPLPIYKKGLRLIRKEYQQKPCR